MPTELDHFYKKVELIELLKDNGTNPNPNPKL